jgi:hypothetical protein
MRAGAGLEFRPVKFFSVDLIGRYEAITLKNYASGSKVATLAFNVYF